jgi:hypothetical protein
MKALGWFRASRDDGLSGAMRAALPQWRGSDAAVPVAGKVNSEASTAVLDETSAAIEDGAV